MKKDFGLGDITSGLLWAFGERITAQLVSTIVAIILARLLTPEHYGTVAVVTVFITFCNIFVTSGFGSAIVQKKEVSDVDYSSAFFISLAVSLLIYILLFFMAPLISAFYGMADLCPVLRVMALRLPIASINTIQQASVQRNMKFRKFFISTIFGTVLSGIIGVFLAFSGFGVWALVFQYLTNSAVDTIVLWIVGDWRPQLAFSTVKAREIYTFGWKVLATDLVYTIEEDIRALIVGKVFGAADLAYYDQGKKYPAVVVNNLNTAITKVMLPTYSRSQENLEKLKYLLRKTVNVGIYVLAPMMIGFAVVSKNFICLILTEKWISCVPFTQIFCITYLTRPLESACHEALLAIGKSGVVLKIMIVINVFALIMLLYAVFGLHSVLAIAITYLFTTLISLILFMFFSYKYIGYKLSEQLKDIIPSLSIALVMGGIVGLVDYLPFLMGIRLIIQILLGIGVYIGLSYVLKLEAYEFALGKVKLFCRVK